MQTLIFPLFAAISGYGIALVVDILCPNRRPVTTNYLEHNFDALFDVLNEGEPCSFLLACYTSKTLKEKWMARFDYLTDRARQSFMIKLARSISRTSRLEGCRFVFPLEIENLLKLTSDLNPSFPLVFASLFDDGVLFFNSRSSTLGRKEYDQILKLVSTNPNLILNWCGYFNVFNYSNPVAVAVLELNSGKSINNVSLFFDRQYIV